MQLVFEQTLQRQSGGAHLDEFLKGARPVPLPSRGAIEEVQQCEAEAFFAFRLGCII